MNRNDALRRKYFFQGASALRALGAKEDVYACPTCRIGFGPDALDNGLLTLEDVPPKSVGGRPLLLTCKNCNNAAGYQFEHHLKLREEVRHQALGILGEHDGELGHFRHSLGDIELNVSVSRSANEISLSVSTKNNPADLSKVKQLMEKMGEGDTMQLHTGKRYIPNKAALADQKSAFLTLGAKFGYTYFFNNRTNLVREQIRTGETGDTGPILKYLRVPDEQTERLFRYIGINEEQGVALMVLSGRVVAMPWISHPESTFLERFRESSDSNITVTPLKLPNQFEAILDFRQA